MDGKKIVEYLNQISGGVDVYGYDEQSKKVIVVERDTIETTIMSVEKAFNELREKTVAMMITVQGIFMNMVEPANGGN